MIVVKSFALQGGTVLKLEYRGNGWGISLFDPDIQNWLWRGRTMPFRWMASLRFWMLCNTRY